VSSTSGLGLRRLAVDSAYNASRQLLGIVLGLATSVLVARGLGSQGRGVYALALLLPTLLITLLGLGIGPATVFFVGREEDRLVDIVRDNNALVWWISTITCAIGIVAILLLGPTLFPGVPVALLLLSLVSVPIEMQTDLLQATLQGLQDFRRFNSIDVFRIVVLMVLIFVFVWVLHAGPTGALVANILSAVAAWIAACYFVARYTGARALWSIRLNRGYARRVLSFGSRAHVSNVVAFLNYRADLFLLNLMRDPATVGVYSVSVALGERLWIMSRSVGTVMLPRIASQKTTESDRRQLTPMVARHVLWLSVAMAALVFVFAQPLIRLLYGEEFAVAALGLQLLLPGIVLLSHNRILAADIAGRGHPGINARFSVFGVVVNVVANLILIPHWGVAGASLSTTLSYSLVSVLGLIAYVRLTAVRWQTVLVPQRGDLRLWRQAGRMARARLRRHETAP
jgi:O-antigen/teichoic acid export membrane protein